MWNIIQRQVQNAWHKVDGVHVRPKSPGKQSRHNSSCSIACESHRRLRHLLHLDTGGADNRVGPLFEHTFPPSLSFVGVPKKVLVPRFYEAQARRVAQVLSGRRKLPPVEEMLREMAGVPKSLTHDLWFPRLPEWTRELVYSSVHRMSEDHENFRDNYDEDSELVVEGLRSQGWLRPDHRTWTEEDDGGVTTSTNPGR
jgi:hypothetical protein